MKIKTVLLSLLLAGALQGALIYAPGKVEIVNFAIDYSSATDYITTPELAYVTAGFWQLFPPGHPVAEYPCSPYCEFDVEAFNLAHLPKGGSGDGGREHMGVVPEPSDWSLVLLGMICLVVGRISKGFGIKSLGGLKKS